jgi:predicted Zn-dependent peptidase
MNNSTLPFRSSALSAACSLGLLLAPAFMNAQIDRTKPPAPGPAPEVHLGEHATVELPNGMRLIVVEDHKLPLVSVQVRFDIPPITQGSQAGFVDMVGDLMTAGTTTRKKADIDASVDAIGATLFASNTGLYASALKKNLGPLMELVTDVVQNPTFPLDELESLRARSLSGVQSRHDDPEGTAEAVGRSVTFGAAHPYGEVTTEKTLKAIGREVIAGYHSYFFRPEKGYIVFVGDITESEAKDLAKEKFGKWKPAPADATKDEDGVITVKGIGTLQTLKKAQVPAGVRRAFFVDREDAAQSVIRVSFPLNLLPKDIRSQQAQVMNTILGGGVFNARLMQNLREKRGFTYGAYSSLDVDRYNSSLTVSVSVRTEVTDSAVAEIIKELELMRDTPVTEEELELAKRHMMGSFGRSLEDPRTVARFALNTELNELPADHYRTYLQRLEAITVQQVLESSRAFLHPDKAIILVVGDKERVIDDLAPLSLQNNNPVIQLTEDGERWREPIEKVTDRTAEEVHGSFVFAVGGIEAIAPIRNLRLEYEAPMRSGIVRYTTKWFGPVGFRYLVKDSVELVEEVIYDGSRVQYFMPDGSGEYTDAGLEFYRLEAMIVPETGYDELLEKSLMVGSTTIDGRKAYKIFCTTMSGLSFSEYYDAETGLKLRTVRDQLLSGRSYTITTDYSDWKPINGLLMPHTLSERGGPLGRMVHTLKKVEVGREMPPGFFDVNIPEVEDGPMLPEGFPPEDK